MREEEIKSQQDEKDRLENSCEIATSIPIEERKKRASFRSIKTSQTILSGFKRD